MQCCCHHRYALECRPLSFQLAHVSVFRFCFNCLKDPHSPVPCKMVNEWMEKCEGEGETFKYISANTKDCPKCGSPVEKNGGCNLMTCRCGTFFCWVRVFTSSPVFACSCHDKLSRVFFFFFFFTAVRRANGLCAHVGKDRGPLVRQVQGGKGKERRRRPRVSSAIHALLRTVHRITLQTLSRLAVRLD